MHITKFTMLLAEREVEFTQINWGVIPQLGLVLVDVNMGIFTVASEDAVQLYHEIYPTVDVQSGFLQLLTPAQTVVYSHQGYGFIVKDANDIFRLDFASGEYSWMRPAEAVNTSAHTATYGRSAAPFTKTMQLLSIIRATILSGSFPGTQTAVNGIMTVQVVIDNVVMGVRAEQRSDQVQCFFMSGNVVPMDPGMVDKLYSAIVLDRSTRPPYPSQYQSEVWRHSPAPQPKDQEPVTSNEQERWEAAIGQQEHLALLLKEPLKYRITYIDHNTTHSQSGTTEYAEKLGLSIIVNRLAGKNRLFIKLTDGRWVVLGKNPPGTPLSFRWVGVPGSDAKIDIVSNLSLLDEICVVAKTHCLK